MATYALDEAPQDYRGDAPKVYPLIPEDTILEATLLEIKEEEKPFKDDDGLPVVKLAWTFQVVHDGLERKVWGETGRDFVQHPDCKFFTWTQEILGTELPRGFAIDTDNLIGEKCRLVIGVRSYIPKGKTEEDRKHVNFVADVMRARGSAPAVALEEDPF